MSGRKRTKTQIHKDRAEVARRYLRGEYQADIGASLGLSQSQISYDLKQIRKAWLDSSVQDFDEAKARQLAKIDELERVYWQSWIDSGGKIEKVTTKGRGDGKQAKPAHMEKIVVSETVVGDSRFLAGIQWCITERNKIFGFYAPVKQEHKVEGQQVQFVEVVMGDGDGS